MNTSVAFQRDVSSPSAEYVSQLNVKPELQPQVEALLRAHDTAGASVLEVTASISPTPVLQIGARLGTYEIVA